MLRPIGSIINVSGILGHPPSRVTTTGCEFAFSRRNAPEVFLNLVPQTRGSRECRVLERLHGSAPTQNTHKPRPEKPVLMCIKLSAAQSG
jgi:hypothetical protein